MAGFCLYHNEGALVGLIAGSSLQASLGALAGFSVFKNYNGMLAGSILGFAIDGIKQIHKNFIEESQEPYYDINAYGPEIVDNFEYFQNSTKLLLGNDTNDAN